MLHGLADEAAHGDDALLNDRALSWRPAVVGRQPSAEFGPDALVRPVGDVVVWIALEVQPLQIGRACAHQRKAARVMRVDQLVRRWWRLGEDAEPAERVDSRVLGACR